MSARVRLRQVVLITRDLAGVTARLESELGFGQGYRDMGVGHFGLENRVLPAGDCFVEVLTPITTESTGHRYLERTGRDGGYMAIFQFSGREGLRERIAEMGLRIVWQGDLPDISGTHIDPRDIGGAIVSLDWADPPESWHWAGPDWEGGAPAGAAELGGITALTVAVADPVAVAARWAAALGPGAELVADAGGGHSVVVRLSDAAQQVRFVEASEATGIVGCGLSLATAPAEGVEIGGITFWRTEESEQ